MPKVPTILSHTDARKLALSHQGLLRPHPFGAGKAATNTVIERLGYVQIDTISVVQRAHEHVLSNRVKNFRQVHLEALQAPADRTVFEYWFHAAAYLPMRDYRYYLPQKAVLRDMRPVPKREGREILARIQAEGPLSSRDFDADGHQSTGWWNWKPAKQVLEKLFMSGELMVAGRDGFQKRYDLTERQLPPGTDTTVPGWDEWYRFLVVTMLGALGIGTARDIGYIRMTRRLFDHPIQPGVDTAITQMVADGEVIKLRLQGSDQDWYALPEALDALPLRANRRRARFLSPFDNLVINRQRTSNLFGFDYLLECYVPAPRRQFGYFSSPILIGDQLVGRADCKAMRDHRELRVRCLDLEPGHRVDAALLDAIAAGLDAHAESNRCDRVTLENVRIARAPASSLRTDLEARLQL